MPNILQTTKRQIEILSLIQQEPSKLSIPDLEDHFSVSKATVERDVQQLRSWGITVHSVKGKLRIEKTISQRKYVELLSMYIAFSSSQSVLQKSLSLICQQMKDRALTTFVTINKAVEGSKVLKFAHYNLQRDKTEERTMNPYGITLLGKRWLLLGYVHEHKQLRHYLVENMSNLRVLDKTFKPDKDFDIAKYYENVWGRWHHEKTYKVKIWFDPSVAHIILNRLWHTNQKVRKQKDGSVIFEATVTGLHEITNWVLPWGRLAKVVRPEVLAKKVRWLANEILNDY